jgi:hypothetical protein
MELGAGADAFDDLLAEIATFAEMQRVALVGFLRKEAVCDVFAVARRTSTTTTHIPSPSLKHSYADMLTGRSLNRIFLQFDCDILSVYADIVWSWRPIVYR